jgi:Protein of unknown function (DUF2934)
MKSRNLITNPENTRGSIVPLEVPKEEQKNRRTEEQKNRRTEEQKNGPSPTEIRQRAFEIHIERGGIHGCDLNDWLEAERELQQKYKNEVHEHR